MKKCCAGLEEQQHSSRTHKQLCTELMKGRTTEQIEDDCACWCRQVPSEVVVFGRPEKMLTTSWTRDTACHNVVQTGVRPEAGMESKTQVTYILIKFSERNTDRQVNSSVEVEKMKIERSEAEGGLTWHIRRRLPT